MAKIIVRGEIKTGVNLALVLAGDFAVGQAMNGGTHTPDIAEATVAEAVMQGEGEPFFALVFNCRRRRRGLYDSGTMEEEVERIRKRLPGVDFFGYYAPGEIGAKKTGGPIIGSGFSVSAAVLFAIDAGE